MGDEIEDVPSGLPGDSLDDLLVKALRGRVEVRAGVDLAAAALARAEKWRVQEESFARLARLRMWMRVVTVAAAAMIAVVVGIGYRYWPTSVEAGESVTETAMTYTIDWTTVGVGLFGVTLVGVVLAMLFTPERPQLRAMAA